MAKLTMNDIEMINAAKAGSYFIDSLSLSAPSERDREEEEEEQAIVYAMSVSLKMIYLLSKLNAADYCRTE